MILYIYICYTADDSLIHNRYHYGRQGPLTFLSVWTKYIIYNSNLNYDTDKRVPIYIYVQVYTGRKSYILTGR